MDTNLLTILCILSIASIILFRNKKANPDLNNKVTELQSLVKNLELSIKNDFRINREENTNNAKENRT